MQACPVLEVSLNAPSPESWERASDGWVNHALELAISDAALAEISEQTKMDLHPRLAIREPGVSDLAHTWYERRYPKVLLGVVQP